MALYIVLDLKGNFSDISRNHLHLEQHKYFKPSTKFPDNISDLLPPCEDCWWEDLAAQSRQAAKPLSTSALCPLPKIKLILPPQPDNSVQDLEEDKLEEDECMALLKRHQTSNRGGKAAEAAHPHKRKGGLLLPCKTIKCRARLSQENPESGKGLGEGSYKFECDRCLRAGGTSPDSPVVATATAMPHPSSHTQPCLAALVAGDFSAPIKVTALHACISAPAKAANKAPTSSKYPSAAAAVIPTPNPAAAAMFHPVTTNSPIAADIPVAAAASSTPTVSATASTVPTASAAATLSASVPSSVSQPSSPAVGFGSPAIAPTLCQHLKLCKGQPSTSLTPSLNPTVPSPHRQHSVANNASLPVLGNLAKCILSLERGFEEWVHKDEQWKEELNQRLQKAGL
ncbi:hypothetical protein V8E53_003209 [Lactarius tabidus]